MFKDYIGQSHLLGQNRPITKMIENNYLHSLILHGPPGVGKTTLAKNISKSLNIFSISLNAATCSTQEMRSITEYKDLYPHIIIIIDEFHRLDKKKQDFLLPFTEENKVIIIGTTTENPLYAVSSALRSRFLLFELKKITTDELLTGLTIQNYNIDSNKILDQKIMEKIAQTSNGDVRSGLNILKFLLKNYELQEISISLINETFSQSVIYDKNESEHHNLISALQKSIRASDLDAALHYSARLLKFGDVDSLLRRMIITCYEDIGLANPSLCARTITMVDGFNKVGMPEGRILIANILVEMCLSPKSTSAYNAFDLAYEDLETNQINEIPKHIHKSQPDKYKYDPNIVKYLDNLPYNLQGKSYFIGQNSSKFENFYFEQYLKRKKNLKTKIYPKEV